MSFAIPYGDLNGHNIGIIMKEAVRRVTRIIRDMRVEFEVSQKTPLGNKTEDYVTNVDEASQDMYVRVWRENFPLFGFVGEERKLIIPCTHPTHDLYGTGDPLDGTKAFIRHQSHGVGTMLALVCNGVIIAAYVGDVMTQEIYGYRPGSDKVHRLAEFGPRKVLGIDPARPLSAQYVVLRKQPAKLSHLVQRMIQEPSEGGLFKDIEVTGGSIGIMMARLWKGEVGAAILDPNVETPWDLTPVVGISQKLGFVFVNLETLAVYEPVISRDIYERTFESLVIHESRLPELKRWLDADRS